MNFTSYTLLLYLMTPFIWLYFLFRGSKDSDYLKHWPERLGLIDHSISRGAIHIHCASVGETLAAKPLILAIAHNHPELGLLISTTTPTGRSEVNKLIDSQQLSTAQACYLPIDWPGSCQRFIKRTSPSLSIIMETELWPNFLKQLNKFAVPSLLANGRLSQKSLKKYQKHSAFSRQVFAQISQIAAQYQSDKDNFLSLGATPDNLHLVGNIKFDIQLDSQLLERQKHLKQQWSKDRPCWIAASIHPGEFDLVFDIHKALLTACPSLLLIAVPRHSEKFDELKKKSKSYGFSSVNRSDEQPPTSDNSVVIGDTMGELTLLLGAADMAFVGGSLIERGGHNPLEPAACGLPTIMGASFYNFADIVEKMKQAKALTLVNNQQQLQETLQQWIFAPESIADKAKHTQRLFEQNSGVTEKTLALIEQMLPPAKRD
jgi:3-deoxy-D-manno-octulosonic-acid transferase